MSWSSLDGVSWLSTKWRAPCLYFQTLHRVVDSNWVADLSTSSFSQREVSFESTIPDLAQSLYYLLCQIGLYCVQRDISSSKVRLRSHNLKAIFVIGHHRGQGGYLVSLKTLNTSVSSLHFADLSWWLYHIALYAASWTGCCCLH